MSFDYHEPTSVREAIELGARFGAESRFLAGGTDLMIQIHRGRCAPRQVVSLHRVPGLDAIDVDRTIALDALREHLVAGGTPPWLVDVRMESVLREDFAAAVTDTVARTTGHEPRTFAAFAADHAARFRGATSE